MNIRLYQDQDKPLVEKMILALNKEDFEELPMTHDGVDEFFVQLKDNEEIRVFVAEEEGKVVGFSTFYLSFSTEFGGVYTEIGELYIAPEFRGRGFGKQFIAYLEKESKALGAKSVFLVASNSNTRAQKLYESFGYQVLPRKEYIKSI